MRRVSFLVREQPTSWGCLKAVATMRPEAARVPITPGWVQRVGASLGVDLAAKEAQAR